jgi:prevent-host-death family protein
MRSINALTLRKRLGQILDDVADGGDPLLVTRGNRPLVVLVPAAQYEQAAGTRHQRLTIAARRVAEWRAEYTAGRPDLDPVDLVRQDRGRP